MTGPTAGPNVVPIVAYAMYLPRSARVDISATTALPIAIVPLLPAAWTHRKTINAA